MQEIPVFFLRGLSTKGEDNIQFALFNWGPMYAHLKREFEKRGIALHPVIGMGPGLFDEQAEIATRFIQSHPAWSSTQKIHLLGHSAGGLVGKKILTRMAPEDIKRKIASLVTIATPHGGSYLAEASLQAHIRHPILTWILGLFGFHVRAAYPFYQQLTPANQLQESKNWRAPEGVRLASITAAPPDHLFSWPFRWIRLLKLMREIPSPHDGLLEARSQKFGEDLGEYELDHLTQLGVYNRPEFSRMCDRLADYFKSFN